MLLFESLTQLQTHGAFNVNQFFWGSVLHVSLTMNFSAVLTARSHHITIEMARCYRKFFAISLFPCASRLWNYLPASCFPGKFHIKNFKCNISRYLLNSNSFNVLVLLCFSFSYILLDSVPSHRTSAFYLLYSLVLGEMIF